METQRHSLHDLFSQLGLPAEDDAIEVFIRQHAPLDSATALHEAPFWNASQAHFLRTELCDDADWSEVVDALNSQLRRA